MPNLQQYFGLYYFIGLVLNVKFRKGQLVTTMPGVPDGYEVLLEPVGDDPFRNISGPIDGSQKQSPILIQTNSISRLTNRQPEMRSNSSMASLNTGCITPLKWT